MIVKKSLNFQKVFKFFLTNHNAIIVCRHFALMNETCIWNSWFSHNCDCILGTKYHDVSSPVWMSVDWTLITICAMKFSEVTAILAMVCVNAVQTFSERTLQPETKSCYQNLSSQNILGLFLSPSLLGHGVPGLLLIRSVWPSFFAFGTTHILNLYTMQLDSA